MYGDIISIQYKYFGTDRNKNVFSFNLNIIYTLEDKIFT